ncbi:MAG: sulfite exporter TauE/SafE family protein [Xanthobacteraceae bacterium]
MSAIQSIPYLYTISGFAVGLLVGMTGVGGGALMTPILILLFGIHPAAAVGTDLLHAAATKTAGSVVHGFKGSIDWRVVRRLATGSVPMTVVTVAAMSALDINGAAGRNLVNAVLTLALVATAVVLVFRGRIVTRYADRLGRLAPNKVAALTVVVGAVLGTIVSLSSVGTGAIGVTCLLLLYPKLPAVKIVGSDIAHAVPLTLVAGIGHWLLGSVDFQVFGLLILGSVPGILIGSYAAVRLPEPALRLVLAATLLVVAAKLSLGLLGSPANVVAVESPGQH